MRRAPMLLLASALASLAVVSPATAGETRTLEFKGETVEAPASWPVIRLAERPRTCVRLDRRVVYLGTPSPAQSCPAGAIGRRRAILVDPNAGARALRAKAEASRVRPARVSATSEFTGLGFDACAAPSTRSMRAWEDSPYRAVGVYIGGLNRACSQPNLTAGWVRKHVDAGWNLIPTYVGLQAPSSSCTSCAKLSASAATFQGTAAANDAVADARAIGIGVGSPIYFDMEGYSRTKSASKATLAFLAAWTERLHVLGYDSGVYSSGASGIADLVSRLDAAYRQPDDIWIANWDGRKTAEDPYVPDDAWDDHQRIRQYRGGHNETWGGVTINIDNNYVEGATAGAASAPTPDDPKGVFELVEAPAPGVVRIAGWAYDPNAPAKPVSIRAELGARPGEGGGARHELGPIAVQPRNDLLIDHAEAGEPHGFDVTFPVVGSGKRRICVYALDIGRGSDKLLGCRGVGVPVPVSLLDIKRVSPRAVRVLVRCDWPSGTQCPGQILMRAKVKQRFGVRRRGRRPLIRTRFVKRAIGRRSFRLLGGRSHAFHVALDKRGRLLTRDRARLRAQLVVAIPGGRTMRPVRLR